VPKSLQRARLHRVAASAVAIALLVAVGFLVGRTVTSSTSAGVGGVVDRGTSTGNLDLPNPDATPVPGSTPDMTKPFWDIPYLNQDRLAAKFHGTINGIELGATSGPALECPQVYRPDWAEAIANTPFALNFGALPKGVSLAAIPEIFFCEDGRPLRMEAVLNVGAGVDGATQGGGQIAISRVAGVRWWREEAPERRWRAGVVAGRGAALLDQPIATIAESAVFVLDPDTDGSTRFKGLGTTLKLTELVAEALLR